MRKKNQKLNQMKKKIRNITMMKKINDITIDDVE